MTPSNTKIFIESLGIELELKSISLRDYGFIDSILKEDIPDIEFVLKVLFNQIIGSIISYEQFLDISEQGLIGLGESFIENNNELFKYFNKTTNFFCDFKLAIVTHRRNFTESLTTTVHPYYKSLEETANLITRSIEPILKQSLSINPYFQDLLKTTSRLVKQLPSIDIAYIEPFSQINSQLLESVRIITEYLHPQIDLWERWIKQNEKVFKSISDYWVDFEKISNITEFEASEVLRKYKWFVTPSIPASFLIKVIQIDANPGRQDKAINKLFIQFFEDNNWQKLEMMFAKWKENSLFKSRYKIIKDCVEVIKSSNNRKTNVVNVVLPTLITQIDGLITDYLLLKGLSWDVGYDDLVDSKTGKTKKTGRKTLLTQNKPQVLSPPLDELATEIFLNILFQNSRKSKKYYTPFNFNRHKIIHGDNTHYGRKDYLIRAFLILDFFAYISVSDLSE